MKAILLLFVFVSLTECLFQIPLQQHQVNRDVLKAQWSKRLVKLGGSKTVRVLPKYHQKLLQYAYPTDYITANISLGTPQQNFTVSLSSGLTKAWVFSSKDGEFNGELNEYNASDSSTSEDLQIPFSYSDPSFSMSGDFFSDTFQIGNALVPNQAFGVVDSVFSFNFDTPFPYDGELGLNRLTKKAYENTTEPTAPIENILKVLQHAFVNFYLDKAKPPSQGHATGLVTIGGVDNLHCDYSTVQSIVLTSSPVDNRLIFNVDVFKYGDDVFGYQGSAYIDTAVSGILLPGDAIQQFMETVNPDFNWELGIYTVPCDTILKPFYFKHSDKATIHIDPEHLVADLDLSNNQCALLVGFNWDNPAYSEDYILGAPTARTSCLTYDFAIENIHVYPLNKSWN